MIRLCLSALLATSFWIAGPGALAQPAVVTDTPVIHSLVSMVMGDIADPALLMNGSASPHHYSLRPSEATTLYSAELLVWTSHELTPWLSQALQNSRQPINHLELMSTPDTIRLGYRQDPRFDDGHDHGHESEHGEQQHSEHDDAHETASSNEQSGNSRPQRIDPHGWLDPVNAIYWLGLIADELAAIDPENASQYKRNTQAAVNQLSTLQAQITTQLEPFSGLPFVVFHDSYHYFEDRFSIFAQAAIALGDAEMPGIRRMNELKEQLREYDGACLFTEPQFSDRLVTSLTRGLDISVGALDPVGSKLPIGPELYAQVLQQLSNELQTCLRTINIE